jgi:hypothetical protein
MLHFMQKGFFSISLFDKPKESIHGDAGEKHRDTGR